MGGGYLRYRTKFLEQLPFLILYDDYQDEIVAIVERILDIKKWNSQTDISKLENQIDIMTYKLYGLTYEEVKIIDPEFWMSEEEY